MAGRRGLNLYHESGHAVALLVASRHFDRVTPNCVKFGPGDRGASDLTLAHLSGVAAESLAGADTAKAWQRAGTDAKNARQCAAQALERQGKAAGRAEIERQLESDWREAVTLLKRHWSAIERLAARLEHGDISYEQAKAIWQRPSVISEAFCEMKRRSYA
jgi:hypothetical protein